MFRKYPIDTIHNFFDEDLKRKYKKEKNICDYKDIDEILMGKLMYIVRGIYGINKWMFLEYTKGDIEIDETVQSVDNKLKNL